MDENSCIATRNIIPTIVKNDKTAGLIAEADGRISQEYLKCQVRYYQILEVQIPDTWVCS